MLRLLFPPKKHPEDANDSVLLMAKLLLVFGLFSLVWSGVRIARWIESFSYIPTEGMMDYGNYALVRPGWMQGAGFIYQVAGRQYKSDEIVSGGRPFGSVPPPGPVTVYYNPRKPEQAILYRRPVDTVYLALIIGLASPFVARKLWDWA